MAPPEPKDELELAKLDAERRKVEAEERKLVAETRKLQFESSRLGRALPALTILIGIAGGILGLYLNIHREAREQADAALRRHRTIQGKFEIGHRAWFSHKGETLSEVPPCVEAKIASSADCENGHGVLCSRRFPNGTEFRRYRCWQSFPSDLSFVSKSLSVTVALSALDFEIDSKPSEDSYCPPTNVLRNPRVEAYATDVTEQGFEVLAEVWGNTCPWEIGIAWTATGTLQR